MRRLTIMTEAVPPHSVLVVDDDDSIRTMIRRILTRAGYGVTEAADGEIAIERLAAGSYDAVVLDLMMPRVNGFEVLDYMRSHLGSRRCVIIVSAAAERTISSADAALVVNTLRKPFDLEALLAAIEDCVREE